MTVSITRHGRVHMILPSIPTIWHGLRVLCKVPECGVAFRTAAKFCYYGFSTQLPFFCVRAWFVPMAKAQWCFRHCVSSSSLNLARIKLRAVIRVHVFMFGIRRVPSISVKYFWAWLYLLFFVQSGGIFAVSLPNFSTLRNFLERSGFGKNSLVRDCFYSAVSLAAMHPADG
jgi:hypothetical protein